MRHLIRAITTATVVGASVVALALPTSAAANTGDGSGTAPFTIYASYFTAYSCTLYRYSGGIPYYSCTGGVRSNGYFYSGTKCARKNNGWGWYNEPCWRVL